MTSNKRLFPPGCPAVGPPPGFYYQSEHYNIGVVNTYFTADADLAAKIRWRCRHIEAACSLSINAQRDENYPFWDELDVTYQGQVYRSAFGAICQNPPSQRCNGLGVSRIGGSVENAGSVTVTNHLTNPETVFQADVDLDVTMNTPIWATSATGPYQFQLHLFANVRSGQYIITMADFYNTNNNVVNSGYQPILNFTGYFEGLPVPMAVGRNSALSATFTGTASFSAGISYY